MEKVQIIDARDTVKLTPTGALRGYTRIEYMIGELGPFAWEVPTEESTPEGFTKEVEKRRKLLESVK